MTVSSPPATTKVATCRHPCVAGPDLSGIEAEDGTTAVVEPTFDAEHARSTGGRTCARAVGPVPGSRPPNRAPRPMMRTRPRAERRAPPRSTPPGRSGGAR